MERKKWLYPEYDVKQINYLCQKHYKQYYSKYPIDPIWKKNFYKSLGKYLNPFSDYHKRRKNFPRDYNIIPHCICVCSGFTACVEYLAIKSPDFRQ